MKNTSKSNITKDSKHGDLIAITPAGNRVIFATGMWGTGLVLEGHDESAPVHISCGDPDGENNALALSESEPHLVCCALYVGGIDCRDCADFAEALEAMDYFKSAATPIEKALGE